MLLDIIHEIFGNTANLIAAVSSLATLFTGLLTLFTIRETKRQRESTYRPELYMETTSAQLISPEFAAPLCYVKFMQNVNTHPTDAARLKPAENMEYDTERFLPPQRWMIAHFFNIGLGTAKSVSYYWDFDLDAAIESLKRYIGGSPMELSENRSGKNGKDIIYSITDDKTYYRATIRAAELQKVRTTDFIKANCAPVLQSQVMISDEYLAILVHYILYKYNLVYEESKNFITESFEDIPPLYLHVTYRDVQNKKHLKKFRIRFSFYSVVTTAHPRPALITFQNIDFGTLYDAIEEVVD